jgi:hypothetical protein
MLLVVTGLPDNINQYFAEASINIEEAKSAIQRLEDSLAKASKIQEQINLCKSSQNYISKEEIRRTIIQSNEKIEEATRILKRIEELENMPGFLSEKDIKDLSSSLDLFKHELSL